jgi:hypothetical protein
MPMTFYAIAADIVLIVHVAVALFVVGGLVLIVAANVIRLRCCYWMQRWVNTSAFRLLHLAAIAVVVGEAWLGIVCPLTTLEMWLRELAGQGTYSGNFIAHWLGRLLFYTAPPWVFTLVYSAFGLLVLASWFVFPVKRK